MVYRYTCSKIYIFLFIFFSLFFLFWNSDVNVKFGRFNCLPSQVSLHVHFFCCSDSTQLAVFVELVTIIPSWDTFNNSMGPTAVPMIRVPRVRIDLATLSSK